MYIFCFCFFFFKQKTAYEMRISDWSSDVCSSDLNCTPKGGKIAHLAGAEGEARIARVFPGKQISQGRDKHGGGVGGKGQPTPTTSREGVGEGKRGAVRLGFGGSRSIQKTKIKNTTRDKIHGNLTPLSQQKTP